MPRLIEAADILHENWACVTDAQAREPGVREPVALLLDFRFARARRLARLLCWDSNVEEHEAEFGPDELVLVAVASRRDAADALALVSPRAAQRLRRKRIPPGNVLVAVVCDRRIPAKLVKQPVVRAIRR